MAVDSKNVGSMGVKSPQIKLRPSYSRTRLHEALESVTIITSDYTLTTEDEIIMAEGEITIKASFTDTTDKIRTIHNKGDSPITFDANDLASTTINKEKTQLISRHSAMKFIYDGTEYWII